MHKLGVEEGLVSAIIIMYQGANKTVRTGYSNTECFADKVGMS